MKRTLTDLNNPAHPSHQNQLISTEGRKVKRVWYPGEPLFESVQNDLTLACYANRYEVCGLITEGEQDIYFIDNAHNEPKHNFLFEQLSFEAVIHKIYQEKQERVMGVFHTHPNNVTWPTPRDIAGWPNPDLKWRYWIATNREVIEWELV